MPKLAFFIDEELHRKLKERAASQGKELYEFIRDVLRKEARSGRRLDEYPARDMILGEDQSE